MSTFQVLTPDQMSKLKTGDLIKYINELQAHQAAEVAALSSKIRDQADRRLSFKVTDKGGVSVYGLGRFPVTLYRDQWVKLLSGAKDIETFLQENEAKLTSKPAKGTEAKPTPQPSPEGKILPGIPDSNKVG